MWLEQLVSTCSDYNIYVVFTCGPRPLVQYTGGLVGGLGNKTIVVPACCAPCCICPQPAVTKDVSITLEKLELPKNFYPVCQHSKQNVVQLTALYSDRLKQLIAYSLAMYMHTQTYSSHDKDVG